MTVIFSCCATAWLFAGLGLVAAFGRSAVWPLGASGVVLVAGGAWWLRRRFDRDARDREEAGAALAAAVARTRDLEEENRALIRAQADLRLLRTALEATPLAWLVTDREARILWANPAFTVLTGHAVADVIGQTPRFLRSGRHTRAFFEEMWTTILRGDVWTGDVHNVRKDGTHYREHLVVAPVRGDGAAVTHFVALKRDVTDERRIEVEASRAQRIESIGLLACGIAHDLNNVLSAILLSVDLMRADPRAVSPQALELVHQSARRGAEIVRQILVFARGADGERGDVDAARLVRDIARFIEETFPRNIEVRVALAPDLGSVEGDVTQLHQVLLNLAVNARDVLPNGGLVTLGAEVVDIGAGAEGTTLTHPVRPGRYVALRVADTGPGMPPAVVARLFEPFFTTKPRGYGTGLGLSTAQAIVRSHGGVIQVRTEIDVGTTFTVLLPRRAGLASGAGQSGASAGLVAGAGRRLLLVDDEPAILEVLSRMLRRHGFEVRCARDGLEGRTVFMAGGPWHAALVDQQMPRMDGLRLVEEMRREAPALPVVLMSGVVHDPGPAEAGAPDPWELGVRTFLAKPFTETELLQALRREIVLPPRG